MQLIVFFLLFGAVVSDLSSEWDKFQRDYHKQYKTTTEENERQQIFINNVNRMHSYQRTHPDVTFTMAINHLMDRRIEELVLGPRLPRDVRSVSSESSIDVKNFPESLDWRAKNVISPVFLDKVGLDVTAVVSTELVETLHAIETGILIKGSIAQVYDCCPQPIEPFACIQNMSGICRDSDYPAALGSCEPSRCKPFTTFDKIIKLGQPDENVMLAWIQDSTLWAEINLAGEGFQTYTTGIYDEPSCSKDQVDYVVQIVGYGVEEGKPYWLCKNSWGENWGEKGYFRIARGKNMCRIAEMVIQVANSKTSVATTTPTDATTKTSDAPTTKSDATEQYTPIPVVTTCLHAKDKIYLSRKDQEGKKLEFVLRRADVNDVHSLSELCEQTYREALVEHFGTNDPEKDPNSDSRSSPSPEWFSQQILDRSRAVWVIEDKTNGELIAYAVAGPADQKSIPHDDLCANVDGAINCLFVRHDYQSHGFGRELMNVILPWLEEQHPHRPVWLNVWSGNLKAQRFYTHYGFIQVGEAEFLAGERKDHDFIMKRPANQL